MAGLNRDLKMTWYGHATFVYETPGGKRIMVDPWVQTNPACPDNLKDVGKLDAILITHGHFDHIADLPDVAKASQPEAVVSIFDMDYWLKKKGIDNRVGFNKGGTVDVVGVKVTMVHAEHSCGITDDDGSVVYGGEAVGYILEMENGLKVYQSGDTMLFGDMKLYGEYFRPDVAVLPIGDFFTMDPKQAAYACEMLGVKYVVPSHYGTFPLLSGTPEALRQELVNRNYNCEVLETSPGGVIS